MKLKSIADILEHAHGALPAERDDHGWNSDHEIFDQLVVNVMPSTIIEVGTWKGRSAAHLAAASAGRTELDEVSGHMVPAKTKIYCVDTWLGGVDHILSEKPVDDIKRDAAGYPGLYHQFLRNFADGPWAEHAKRIHPIAAPSLIGAKVLAAHGIMAKLIYVDGSHEYEDVYADLCAYANLLEPGGVLFGDDFRGFPGVFAAVLRFAHETGRKLDEVDHNFWVLRTP